MPRRSIVGSAAVLVRCGICESLVPLGSVETGSFIWRDGDGRERIAKRRSCSDVTACYLRTDDPRTWQRLGATLPVSVEPPPGAPLAKCTVCDITARVDDLDIARVLDGVWYSSVVCADEDSCYDRQMLYPYRPGAPRVNRIPDSRRSSPHSPSGQRSTPRRVRGAHGDHPGQGRTSTPASGKATRSLSPPGAGHHLGAALSPNRGTRTVCNSRHMTVNHRRRSHGHRSTALGHEPLSPLPEHR
jgi:hypothetical protein